MRNKRGISLVAIIFVMFIIILAIALCAVLILKDLDKEDKNDKAENVTYAEFMTQNIQLNENKTAEEDNKNINEIKKEEQVSSEYINKWVGTYENNNTSIVISKFNEKSMYVSISKTSNESLSASGKSFSVTVESENNQIVYEREFMDDIDKAVITYTDSGINVQSSSTDADSLLNEISGNYIKKESKQYEKEIDWEGTYINGVATISITDSGIDSLNIVIKGGISNYTYIVNKDDGNEKITYEHEFFDEIDKFIIEKTNEGIKVEANSTDTDSLLNRISGEYTKQ